MLKLNDLCGEFPFMKHNLFAIMTSQFSMELEYATYYESILYD